MKGSPRRRSWSYYLEHPRQLEEDAAQAEEAKLAAYEAEQDRLSELAVVEEEREIERGRR